VGLRQALLLKVRYYILLLLGLLHWLLLFSQSVDESTDNLLLLSVDCWGFLLLFRCLLEFFNDPFYRFIAGVGRLGIMLLILFVLREIRLVLEEERC